MWSGRGVPGNRTAGSGKMGNREDILEDSYGLVAVGCPEKQPTLLEFQGGSLNNGVPHRS
jgi:hypothetical protein